MVYYIYIAAYNCPLSLGPPEDAVRPSAEDSQKISKHSRGHPIPEKAKVSGNGDLAVWITCSRQKRTRLFHGGPTPTPPVFGPASNPEFFMRQSMDRSVMIGLSAQS